MGHSFMPYEVPINSRMKEVASALSLMPYEIRKSIVILGSAPFGRPRVCGRRVNFLSTAWLRVSYFVVGTAVVATFH